MTTKAVRELHLSEEVTKKICLATKTSMHGGVGNILLIALIIEK